MIFITMEDETGLLDVTVFERVYQQWGKVIYSNSCLIVDGEAAEEGAIWDGDYRGAISGTEAVARDDKHPPGSRGRILGV